MDSFTSILQLLEIPTSVFKELNQLYHHCNNNKEKCNQQCIISPETKSCLNNCLINQPYETNSIIVKLTEKYNKKHEKPLENLTENVIIENMEMCDEVDIKNIYSLLSLLEFCDNFHIIFQLLYELIQDGKLDKNVVYVILLPQNNQEIIKKFMEYEKSMFTKCDINDTSSLLRYCLVKNEHWLLNVLTSDYNIELKKLLILKLLLCTNSETIDFGETQQIISQIPKINDKFLWFYMCSIKWNLEMFHFIGNKTIFLEPCLQTLSRFIDLRKIDQQKFIEINQLLNKHTLYLCETGNETKSEVDLFNGLCLIITIKNIILNDINCEELLKNIKQQLFMSTNRDFLLEVLENVYVLIFLQKHHFQNENEDFICDYPKVLFVANFLKKLILKLKRKYFPRREKNPSFLRFQNLSHFVEILEWKLNLFKSEHASNEQEVIEFLVSPPETYIYYCLENDNIFGAGNVVQVSLIQQTQIAHDIEYVANFQQIKQNTTEDLIKFCSLNPKQKQSNLLDLLVTLDRNEETSKIILNQLENESMFSQNLKQIFDQTNQTVPQIITSSNIPLNFNEFCDKEKHLFDLEILLKEQFESGKKIVEIAELLNVGDNNYLLKTYNYLRKLAEIYSIKPELNLEKPDDVVDLIRKNTAELVGILLVKYNHQPKDFEKLFAKLKLDIVYKISWNFLPEIELNINLSKTQNNLNHHRNENLKEIVGNLKEIYVESNNKLQHSPDFMLLSYIQKRNWLLAYLMNKIYFKDKEDLINSDQTKYFNNLLNVKSIRRLNQMFDNSTIAVLYNNDMIFAKLLQFMDSNNSESVLEIINGIPESLIINNQDLIHIKDLLIYDIICKSEETQLIQTIFNNNLRVKCILENLNKWTGKFCIQILKCELMRWDLNIEHEEIIKLKFFQIDLYENMKNVFNLNSWHEVYEKSSNQPREIFQLLLTSKHILLLLKWIEIHKPQSNELLQHITTDYLRFLLDNNTDLNQIKTLLDQLQFEQRILICKNLLKNLTKNWEHNLFLITYLTELLPELENEYKNTMISLKIFSCFSPNEHEFMYCLINKPLLIIEQLIMNVRLEKLSIILEKIKPYGGGIDLTTETVDELLRNYAKKALDFRGIQPAQEQRNLELKLMQSLDTVSVDSERRNFVIPDQVPDKSNWVQNEQALECMCCRETIFSMFNRRHHCRRCGRVICGNCSLKKIQIPEYGSIPVRVCNDCFKQSQTDETNQTNKSEQSSTKSGSFTCWLLTDDEKQNEIAREEFSFEYAPSVSLCLSILKAHSPNIEYSRFLLDQCKVLLPYLQDGVSEIDFSFMIQMIKSLVTVAKLTALNNSFKSELIECNEILLQIELMNLLVEKDCLELLRSSIKNPSDFYNHSRVLRRLRDKLIEQEYWSLALDISTKVGLDKTGIFAAWGKSHLKAGALQMAREKFQYCLEKHQQHDPDLRDLSISYSYDKSINLSTVSEVRPTKTPPLINEIIHVLENNDPIQDKTLFRNFRNFKSSNLSLNVVSGGDPPVCILNKLKNLKKITDLKKSSKLNDLGMDTRLEFYNECLYYLMKYASHSTILHFFLRHQEFDEALNYLLENRLSIEYFVEIYMRCLEENRIEKIQQTMQKIDITLDVWEVYLKGICRHLEKNSMYNTLYQLQIFMCDYVRAAMTCIKFYQENSRNFRELLGREEHLHRAQNHLKQELEHEQWVKVTPVRKTSSASSGSSTPSISTHSLQMKLDPRNIDRYINTIWRQIEITKFLAECESENRPTFEILNTFPEASPKIPTLFESTLEKTKLAVLVLVCGRNIEEGFGIAFRIIQDHNLKFLKVYCFAAQYLASILMDLSIVELINCIKSSGMSLIHETCDDVLMIGVSGLVRAGASGSQLDNVLKLIVDPAIKIEAFIECGQLKRAYLLAIKHQKMNEVRKILREAERLNQPQIKAICLKRLNQSK